MTDLPTPLPWDSNLLGFPVGRLGVQPGEAPHLAHWVAQARQAGFRLLYLSVAPADAAAQAAAQQAGAVLLDRKVTYRQTLAGAPAAAPAIVPVTQSSPVLRALALQSGAYSRFRLDPHLAPGVYEALYEQWLANSLNGQLARAVLAFQPAGQPLGLLTLGERQGRADIGLLAVAEAARGRGIGRQLVTAAQALAHDWGLHELQVVTQLANEPACRLYEACGLRLAQLEYVYHLWLET